MAIRGSAECSQRCLSVCLSGRLSGVASLNYTLDARLIFFMIFTFFVENHLLGNRRLSFLVLWLKSYRPCRQRALYFSLFLDSLLKITYCTREHKIEFLSLISLRVTDLADKGPYISHYFRFFVN